MLLKQYLLVSFLARADFFDHLAGFLTRRLLRLLLLAPPLLGRVRQVQYGLHVGLGLLLYLGSLFGSILPFLQLLSSLGNGLRPLLILLPPLIPPIPLPLTATRRLRQIPVPRGGSLVGADLGQVGLEDLGAEDGALHLTHRLRYLLPLPLLSTPCHLPLPTQRHWDARHGHILLQSLVLFRLEWWLTWDCHVGAAGAQHRRNLLIFFGGLPLKDNIIVMHVD